jgi:hypothetical protein
MSKINLTGTKGIIAVVALVAAGIFAVLGQVFADAAKTPFGWTLWDILTGVGIVTFLGAIFYLAKVDNEESKQK